MRLTSLAACVVALALAGVPAINTIAPRAVAAQQSYPGPLGSSPNNQPQVNQPDIPQSQETLKVQTTLVNVFATVRDKHNAIISNLTQESFKIYEDGAEQKVAYFAKEVNIPLTLGLLIDTSGSMDRVLPAEQDTASRFLKEVMHKKDEAMVIGFDFDINLLADFTEDTSVLERAIRRTRMNAMSSGGVITPGTIPQGRNGGTDLYDAVYLACHDELATEAGRKAVILLTDAEDTGSKLSLQDAIEAAQRSDAVIHVLLIQDFSVASGEGAGVASRMAEQTGGRVINVHNEKTLEKAFDQISEELRSQYVLGYYPTNTKRDGSFRKIKVEATRTDTKILARRGYYAPVR